MCCAAHTYAEQNTYLLLFLIPGTSIGKAKDANYTVVLGMDFIVGALIKSRKIMRANCSRSRNFSK